jgi:hypothetical protein
VANARGKHYADTAFADSWYAPAADAYSIPASARERATFTSTTVTNGAVTDTPQNRARYGGPMPRAGKRTAPQGN